MTKEKFEKTLEKMIKINKEYIGLCVELIKDDGLKRIPYQITNSITTMKDLSEVLEEYKKRGLEEKVDGMELFGISEFSFEKED